jgi:hypothetical protein
MISQNTKHGSEHPLYLYKYRSGSIKDIETLSRKKIFVPDFNNLNDIYKNDFSFELDIALNNANIHYPHVIKDGFGEPMMAPVMLSRGLKHLDLEIHRTKIRENIRSFRERIFGMGVYSLSHIAKNHLMWAHYSNEYKGYCIEYKIPPKNNCSKDTPCLYPVEYVEAPHKIEWSLIEHYNIGLLKYYMIGNKPMCWNYELEYRAIFPTGQKEFDIPYEIESIIFGPESEPNLKQSIKDIFGTTIIYREAIKMAGTYELDVVDIE